jgi:hypothetical protein
MLRGLIKFSDSFSININYKFINTRMRFYFTFCRNKSYRGKYKKNISKMNLYISMTYFTAKFSNLFTLIILHYMESGIRLKQT